MSKKLIIKLKPSAMILLIMTGKRNSSTQITTVPRFAKKPTALEAKCFTNVAPKELLREKIRRFDSKKLVMVPVMNPPETARV